MDKQALLKRHVDMPFKMNDLGIAVGNSPQFDALREALVNMLMHTDYFSPAKPRVRIFSNRIEFENPGAFPRSIEIFLRKDISIPRNPVLAKLFRSAKLAENAGYGFDKMLAWEKSTQTKVVFGNSIDVAQVTFPFFPEDVENEQEKDEQENAQEKSVDQISGSDSNDNGVSSEQKTNKKQPENTQETTRKQPENNQKTSKKQTENGDVANCNSDNNTSVDAQETSRKRAENEQKTSRKRAENEQKDQDVENAILEMIKLTPKISRSKISNQLGFISRGGVSHYLENLKKKGIIKREGPDKGGIWIVIDHQDNP